MKQVWKRFEGVNPARRVGQKPPWFARTVGWLEALFGSEVAGHGAGVNRNAADCSDDHDEGADASRPRRCGNGNVRRWMRDQRSP